MLLDLRMMANAKSKDVLDAADRFEREGCVMTSSGFRRYSKMWTNFANELGVIYDELFMED